MNLNFMLTKFLIEFLYTLGKLKISSFMHQRIYIIANVVGKLQSL